MHELQLTIASPLDLIYQEQVDRVTVTTSSGEITILPHHIPLISPLEVGHVLVQRGENKTYFTIDGGLLEVRRDNHVVILSDRSEEANAIDLERAERAMEKAKEYLKNPEESGYSYRKLQAMMAKEENRAKIARRGGRK